MRYCASPPYCVLVAGLDHLFGGEEGSVHGAHVFKQAVVVAAVSWCINHRRETAGQIFVHQGGLEHALEGPNCDPGVGDGAVAICMEGHERLPELTLIMKLIRAGDEPSFGID